MSGSPLAAGSVGSATVTLTDQAVPVVRGGGEDDFIRDGGVVGQIVRCLRVHENAEFWGR